MYQLWQLTKTSKTSFRLGVVHQHHPALNFPVYVTWYGIIPFLGLYGYMWLIIPCYMWLYHLILCDKICIMLRYTIPMPLPGSEQLLFDAWLQRLVPWQACSVFAPMAPVSLNQNGVMILRKRISTCKIYLYILCRLCYDCYEARNCSQMPVVRTPATLWHLVTGMMSSIRSAPSLREDSPTYLIPPLGSCCKIVWKFPALNNLQQLEDPTAQCVLSPMTLHGSESGRTRKILKKPHGSCFWILGGNC